MDMMEEMSQPIPKWHHVLAHPLRFRFCSSGANQWLERGQFCQTWYFYPFSSCKEYNCLSQFITKLAWWKLGVQGNKPWNSCWSLESHHAKGGRSFLSSGTTNKVELAFIIMRFTYLTLFKAHYNQYQFAIFDNKIPMRVPIPASHKHKWACQCTVSYLFSVMKLVWRPKLPSLTMSIMVTYKKRDSFYEGIGGEYYQGKNTSEFYIFFSRLYWHLKLGQIEIWSQLMDRHHYSLCQKMILPMR